MSVLSGCKTTSEVALPPKPEREFIPYMETIDDYARTLTYYSELVRKWEAWADTVEKIVEEEEKSKK